MKKLLLAILAPILCASFAFAAKEALLIANADYSRFGKLPNPISDAKQLADALQQIGFNVSLVENANREQMLDALGSFEERLKASQGIAFFHYGGHGVQVDGRNFLIPADADIPDEKRVATRAIDVDEVMSALDASGSSVNVVVLDACRDNPLPATSTRSATRGLSVVATKPKNSIVVYAAEAGSKATDGLFTPILAKALVAPGKSISQIMAEVRNQVYQMSEGSQTPGEYSQLFSEVFLNGEGQATRADASSQSEMNELRAMVLDERANAALDANASGDAEDLLMQVMVLKPDTPALWRRIAIARMMNGKTAEAASAAEKHLERDPDDAAMYALLGAAQILAGDYERADETLHVGLRKAPNQRDLIQNLSELRRLQNRPADAAAILDRYLKQSPEDGFFQFKQAMADVAGNLSPALRKKIKAAIAGGNATAGIYVVAAAIDFKDGKPDAAKAKLKDANTRASAQDMRTMLEDEFFRDRIKVNSDGRPVP